jgi:glutamate carboxypeptidase
VARATTPWRASPELLVRAGKRRDDLVKLVLAMAQLDAPSGAGARAMTAAADQLAAWLSGLPTARLQRTAGEQGDVLEVRLGCGQGVGALILGHYDTVWPAGTAASRPPRLSDDGRVIRGPGVFDMRGGIAAALVALRLLADADPVRPVTVLLTPDEETGSATSEERIVTLARQAEVVLVLEPPLPGGALKTSRRGWAVYRLMVTGRAAHAGLEPERGVNAIDELCDRLIDVRELAGVERGTTLNAGRIEGGSAPNVVPERAEALIDVRGTSVEEQERVDAALCALKVRRDGASVEVSRLHLRPAMERSPAVAGAFEQAQELAAAELAIALREGAAGGTSDANLIAHLGVPVLDGLGPEGGGAHALEEHILVDSLVERTALLALLVSSGRWTSPPGAG